jgi:hypothetical protein
VRGVRELPDAADLAEHPEQQADRADDHQHASGEPAIPRIGVGPELHSDVRRDGEQRGQHDQRGYRAAQGDRLWFVGRRLAPPLGPLPIEHPGRLDAVWHRTPAAEARPPEDQG